MSTEALEKMLSKGIDNALLRFGLGKSYLDAKDLPRASENLQRCVAFDPSYSAAWKLLGQALNSNGNADAARHAWQQGIAAAQAKGDKQAEKEMTVFLRRLERLG